MSPVVVVVGILFLSTGINGIGGNGWNPYVNLATAPTAEAPSPVFADRPVWSHALWILALVLLVGVVALLRHRRDRVVALVGGVAVALAVAGAIGATREMPARSAAEIADRVARPELGQDCIDVSGAVDVCVFPMHSEYATQIVADVSPVAMALPVEAGRLTIRQVYEDGIEGLPPEVRRRLPNPVPVRPGNEVPFSNFNADSDQRLHLALVAVGLPSRPDAAEMPLVVAGEARGVVAIWLSVRGLDIDEQLRRSSARGADPADPFASGSLDGADVCSVISVVWSRQDLEAVRALVQLPEDAVARLLASDWAKWIDPSTGTDALLAQAGVPPVGPFDAVTPRQAEGC